MARTQLDTKQLTENRIPPLRLAFALTVVFGCFALLPIVRANARLEWSILGAALALLLFQFLLRQQVARSGRRLYYEFLARPVHYVQLMMHMSIYAYWGWYWREVYHQIPLIICQIVFTYVLDMLVCWSRRDKWVLGFGPFPIVLSTNLFLWFKPDWYFLQFLMLATIVLCKEFITWKRDGRRAHIFNPSAVALFIFSVGMILTHSTNISWGEEIAVSQARPPYIFLEIFVLGLVVQALFSVTLVTLSSVATVYAMNLIYTHVTGVYYFTDANIPAAVFLGMHLLVTDPATSPRKNFGKIVFGSLYGAGVFGFVWLLDLVGVPPFYDKLLCVPLLNLTVRALDRVSVALDTRLHMPTWEPRRANFAFMAVWICLFAVMYRTGFLGSYHPGANPEFWREACVEGRPTGCQTWIRQMKVFCSHGSGTACMALGVELDGGQMVPRDEAEAGINFAHACELGLSNGCARLLRLVGADQGQSFQRACDAGDGESCFLLGSLYFAGQGIPQDPNRAFALLQQSCTAGWARGCSGLGECYRAGAGTTVNNDLAIENFDKACERGVASSCFSAYAMYRSLNDPTKAAKRLKQGCQISVGFAESSAAYLEEGLSKRAAVPAICSSAPK
jgi:TPR repeat protein/drug/metabolite transporter superfamily protein YnfA